jgi:UDP-2,3-diacylglucosamine pyrophosphatase LpxH
MKRVIISDTHIGSRFYRSAQLLEFLKSIEYDQIILAGDIIDFIRVPVFTERCIEILSSVDRSKDVVYVVGNHDESLVGLVGKKIMGIRFVNKYEFDEGGRKFRVEHGDSYDEGWIHKKLFVKFISMMQGLLEIIFDFDLTTWWTKRYIQKHKLRTIINILKYNDDVDVFVMGHTHNPEALIWIDADQQIKTYINSGDWVTHQTYVEINDGVARLRKHE